jgi:hypothetical protein
MHLENMELSPFRGFGDKLISIRNVLVPDMDVYQRIAECCTLVAYLLGRKYCCLVLHTYPGRHWNQGVILAVLVACVEEVAECIGD